MYKNNKGFYIQKKRKGFWNDWENIKENRGRSPGTRYHETIEKAETNVSKLITIWNTEIIPDKIIKYYPQ